MKRKIVNGFLMLALIVSTMGSFVSCKDYDEDIYLDLKDRISNQATLHDALQEQVNRLEAAVKELEAAKCNCQQDVLKDYVKKTDLDGYMTTADGSKFVKIEEYTQYVASNNAAIKLLEDAINALKADVATLKSQMATNTESISKLTELLNKANDTALEAKAKAEEALALAKANAEAIKKLQEQVAANQSSINSLTNVVNTLSKTVTNVQNTISQLNETVQNLSNTVAGWDSKLTTLVERTEKIVAQVESNTTRIEELEKLYQQLLEDSHNYPDYEKVQELINDLKQQLEDMNKKWAEELEKAQKEAKEAAEAAKKIAEDALKKAGDAVTTSEKALSMASNAEQLALSALKTAQAAQTAADKAKEDAEAAAKKAEEALNSIKDLVKQAQDARDEAVQAKAGADAAKAAAETAKADAQALKDAADQAKKEAEEWAKKAEEWAKSISGGGLTPEQEQMIKDAKDKAADAEAKAAQAEQKAADAETKAAQAEQKAADAETKAAQAEQKAADAETKAAQAEQKAADAEQAAKDAKDKADKLQGDVDALKEAVKDYLTKSEFLEEIKKYATNDDLTAKYNELKALIDGITVGGIEGWDKAKLDQLYADVETLKGISPSGITLEDLQNALKNYYTKSEVDALLAEELKPYITEQEVRDQFFTKQDVQEQIKNLEDNMIKPLEDGVKDITKEINDIKAALASLVTGVIVQGSENPTLGYFNFPLDIRSTMLLVYYGNQGSFEFPSESTFSNSQLKLMGVSSYEDVPGYYVHGGGKFISGDPDKGYAGNAGTLYLTLNPVGASLDGKTVSLVNSQNVESGVKLSAPAVSSKTLKFGYGRTRADGLLYEVDATLQPEDITGANLLSVNPEALLKQAQEALNSKSVNSILSAGLSFLESFNNKLDCNAVKVQWDGGTVVSQFNVAAAAFEPLAIDMLKSLTVPGIPGEQRIKDLIREIIEQIKIDVPEINFDYTTYTDRIQFIDCEFLEEGAIRLKLDIMLDGDGKMQTVRVTVNLPAGSENAKTLTDLIKLIAENNATILVTTDNGSHVDASLTALVQQLFKDLNKINSFDEEMAVNIEEAKENMIKGLEPYVTRVYNKLNNIFGKVTNVFDLILVARQENGAVAILSKSASMPTKASGSISLLPTSYTLEFFAPAYKKIVAVTNVLNADGSQADTSLAADANKGQNMATVISGDTYVTLNGQPGYIYEVTLAAIDYHAKEVKETFYVQF